jgi:hypothetical protein
VHLPPGEGFTEFLLRDEQRNHVRFADAEPIPVLRHMGEHSKALVEHARKTERRQASPKDEIANDAPRQIKSPRSPPRCMELLEARDVIRNLTLEATRLECDAQKEAMEEPPETRDALARPPKQKQKKSPKETRDALAKSAQARPPKQIEVKEEIDFDTMRGAKREERRKLTEKWLENRFELPFRLSPSSTRLRERRPLSSQ